MKQKMEAWLSEIKTRWSTTERKSNSKGWLSMPVILILVFFIVLGGYIAF